MAAIEGLRKEQAPKIGELARLPATDLLEGYRIGSFTPSDVIEEVIGALEQTDEICNVMVTQMFDSARAEAKAATRAWGSGSLIGPLTGVPITVKDLIFVAGVPARGGAPVFEDFVPEVDSAVVTSLRKAGAIITCKTTTCESGYKLTADSPVSGITRDAASLPVGQRNYDTTPGRLNGVRIAFTPDFGFAAVAPDVRDAFTAALDIFADLGADLVADDLGLDPEVLERTIKPIAYIEQAAAVLTRDHQALARSDREYQDVIARGRQYQGTDYVDAMHRRTMLRSQFLKVFQRAQVMVTPTVAVTAFAAGNLGVDEIENRPVDPHLGWSPFSWPINLAGLPAATIPCGFDRDGLPIGLQIIAPWLDEARIFRVAAAFQAAGPGSGRWPGFVVGG